MTVRRMSAANASSNARASHRPSVIRISDMVESSLVPRCKPNLAVLTKAPKTPNTNGGPGTGIHHSGQQTKDASDEEFHISAENNASSDSVNDSAPYTDAHAATSLVGVIPWLPKGFRRLTMNAYRPE